MKYSNSTVIRCLGGEGGFAILKRKGFFSRFFWALKIIIKLSCMLAIRPIKIDTKDLIYLCGVNQDRLFRSLNFTLYDVNNESYVLRQPRKLYQKKSGCYVSLDSLSYLVLVGFCLVYVLTGKKRYVAAFLLKYYQGVSDFLNAAVVNMDRLICFNDQPFESAALVLWSREAKKKTVVIQHGVLLSYDYYFPTNSHEFWAWGENGRRHFKTKVKGGGYVVKGRFLKEEFSIPESFVLPDKDNMRGVICPSFFYAEIISLIKLISSIRGSEKIFYLKLHPSTKFKFLYRFLVLFYGVGWVDYRTQIFSVAENFDVLVTKNSSAAVDFLMLGKPVFGIDTPQLHRDVFNSCFFSEKDIRNLVDHGFLFDIERLNKKRYDFVKGLIG